jgi:DNA-binding response OmpR family regulator
MMKLTGLTKPFSMRELLARVKALLRRVRLIREEASQPLPSAEGVVIKFDDLMIDLNRHEVVYQGRVLDLRPKEYDLLLFFARHPRQVLSREHILQEVWGWDYVGESRTVDVHVRWLRERIERVPALPSRIITVRSAGYRFEG